MEQAASPKRSSRTPIAEEHGKKWAFLLISSALYVLHSGFRAKEETTAEPFIHRLSLRKNFSWIFVGNLVYALCQWGILIVLAKIGSPDMVGQFALGLAITAPVVMFTNLQLRAVQATDAIPEYMFGDYLALRLLGSASASLLVLLIVIVAEFSDNTSLVILCIGLAKSLESISDILYGLMQQKERMDRIGLSMIIKGPLSFLAVSIAVHLSGSLVCGTLTLAAVWGMVLLLYDMPSARLVLSIGDVGTSRSVSIGSRDAQPKVFSPVLKQQKNAYGNEVEFLQSEYSLVPHWDMHSISRLVRLALPLAFVTMMVSLNANIPRYFVKSYLGERGLGIFAAVAYLIVPGNRIMTALGQACTPRLAQHYASNKMRPFAIVLGQMLSIGVMLGCLNIIVSVLSGREILAVLYQNEYAEYSQVLVWLMVAAAVTYLASVLGYGMTAARKFNVQMPLFGAVTGISFGVSLWLIPKHGLNGAAWAMLIGALTQVIGSFGVLLYAYHRKTDKCL